MALTSELKTQIGAWLEQDPDDATRTQLLELAARAERGEADATAEVINAFAGPLTFGTAGLRAAIGPGPARMNRVVVTQAAAGFAAWLTARGLQGGKVLIGYDARHNSDVFARDTAEVMAAAGFQALLTERHTPTPVVAFGIKHFGCVAAVVVTASHNPPADNGYKVYLGDGSQIIPPTDAEIAAAIAKVATGPLGDIPRSHDYAQIGPELVAAYSA
ncbi:MAG: phospho-sugar mutase, partial [Propionibacteriaceae bacterium]|nr:phospho-sugar mutase [Propionibacteriaceae bacterium]